MARSKNVASDQAVQKAIRANVTNIVSSHYNSPDTEDVVSNYVDFLKDLCSLTPRASKMQLEICCSKVMGVSSEEARCWASAMMRCLQHCGSKIKSCTSGRKQHKDVWQVIQVMKRRDFQSESLESEPAAPDRDSSSKAPMSPPAARSPILRKHGFARRSKMFLSPFADADDSAGSKSPLSSYKTSTRAEVFARFGLSSDITLRSKSAAPAVWDDVMDLQSSQESVAATMQQSSGASSSNVVQFLDTARLVMVRTVAGKSEDARMTAGEDGFMIANFGDGDIPTEVPAVLYEGMQQLPAIPPDWNAKSKSKSKAKGKAKSKGKAAAIKSRAAAKAKGKAKSKSQPQSKLQNPSEDEQDEEEEEDLEDLPDEDDPPTDLYDKVGNLVARSPDYTAYMKRAEAKDRNGKVVAWKTRLKEYPTGCPTCRNVPGCTPSCWTKRSTK